MSWFILELPDPDCPKCHGSGTLCDYQEYGRYPGYPKVKMGGCSIGPCDCRKYENKKKIQDRCVHEYVCKKCDKML